MPPHSSGLQDGETVADKYITDIDMEKGFEKIYGITERRDEVVRRGSEWYLYWGQGKDAQGDYVCRKVYDHKPDEDELKTDITDLINATVDAKILSGYEWSGHKVWLSSENQFNYKAVYDLACKDSSVLPVKFKLSDGTEGKAVYYTFEALEELTSFYRGAIKFINESVNEGWTEKDSIDTKKLLEGAE